MLDPAESDRLASEESEARLDLGGCETLQPCLEQGILGLPCPAAEKAQNLKAGAMSAGETASRRLPASANCDTAQMRMSASQMVASPGPSGVGITRMKSPRYS